jgi:L-ribulose-5-phosphate 4-epimerase
MNKFRRIQEEVFLCSLQLIKSNLVISTFGNVSAIDRKNKVIAIKPSGIPHSELSPEKIVIVDLHGKVMEGKYRPSSDTPTHLELYKQFPNIGGIAHTHSTYATSWAQARKPIPIFGTTHADYLPNAIPCTRVMKNSLTIQDYEINTGKEIIKTIRKYSYERIKMVLVAAHGPFTWGKDPQEAVDNCVILEYLAKMALLSKIISPRVKSLPNYLITKHYSRKHGFSRYYGQ